MEPAGHPRTFNEVEAWHRSAKHLVYAARVHDKLGELGLICCCVAEIEGQELAIRAFVLSCRALGYRVEPQLFERIKGDAVERFGAARIRGRYLPTAHNAPCKGMYERLGFRKTGGEWLWEVVGMPAALVAVGGSPAQDSGTATSSSRRR